MTNTNMTDITDMSDVELDSLIDRKTHVAMLKRLNRLTRAELSALNRRNNHGSPNPVHLASALAKLDDPDGARYTKRTKPGPIPGQISRTYRR